MSLPDRSLLVLFARLAYSWFPCSSTFAKAAGGGEKTLGGTNFVPR